MSRPVVFSDAEVTLRSLAGAMAAQGVGAVVVLGPDGPSMLVTEHDIVVALSHGADPDASWGADAASRELLTADPDDTILDAVRIMAAVNVRHLPVLAGTEVIGMVSARDVLRLLAFSSSGGYPLSD